MVEKELEDGFDNITIVNRNPKPIMKVDMEWLHWTVYNLPETCKTCGGDYHLRKPEKKIGIY